jgi:hypothetical protein
VAAANAVVIKRDIRTFAADRLNFH